MGLPPARRCAIWVSTPTLMAAQQLADLAGVDVDTFVEHIVNELHELRARDNALLGRPTASGSAPVIPISGERQRRQRRRG